MAAIPFIDTHVHLYDQKNKDLQYAWLQPDWSHPEFGDFDPLKALRFDAEAFIAETRFATVSKVVHIQAAIGISDPMKETGWLEGQAERTGVPHAIVAYSSLADPAVEAELERHAGYPRVRGIRDSGQPDYLANPSWQRGFALLEKFGLLVEFDCGWADMGNARDLVSDRPGITAILNHAGFPTARTDEYFRNWRAGLSQLAEAENAICKISGLGMYDRYWTPDSLRPWVLSCIEIFGVERCVFGTNWPVDRLFSSYDPVIDAYASIISDFSQVDQEALFFRNAERIYRI